MTDVKKEPSFRADLDAVQQLLSTAHPVSDVWKEPLYPPRHVYNKSFLLSVRHDRLYNLQPLDPVRRVPEHPLAPPVPLSTSKNPRTADVLLSGPDAGLTFSDLALPAPILRTLHRQKITKPSPVQLRALPAARLGADVIVQAKSGTGKTLVFGIVAAEAAVSSSVSQGPAALLIAPTRELAAQITRVTQNLCDGFAASPHVTLVIGGCPEREDVARIAQSPPGVVVATPGRALALVEKGCLKMEALKLLVLDEADRLLDGSVGDTVPRICEMLPMRKQTLAFSATYPTKLQTLLCKVMRNATHIQVQREQEASQGDNENRMDASNFKDDSEDPYQRAVLLGVQQRKMEVERGQNTNQTTMTAKTTGLLVLLQHIPFSFCIVFTNNKKRSKNVVHKLRKVGFGCAHMNADIRQADRIATMKSVADGNIQVLVTTDLLARGVDIDVCDLVVHLDIPSDSATYLHRVGRAGRFGKLGLSVVIYLRGEEAAEVHGIEKAVGFRMTDMQVQPPKAIGDGNALISTDVTSTKRKRINCTDDGISPDERYSHDLAEVAGADYSLHKIKKSTSGDVSDGRRKPIEVELQTVGSEKQKKDTPPPVAVEETRVGRVSDINVDISEDTEEEVAIAEADDKRGETAIEDSPPVENAIQNVWDTTEAKQPGNDSDGWNAYASRAYTEGYREGYEQAYRMATQLRARLGDCT